MQKAPAYVIISLVFFMIIGVGFAYSYFFYPNEHPVDCIIKSVTGKDCPTCGFSRAFSYYTHLEFALGKSGNQLSWPVFLFFVYQFFFRAIIVLHYIIVNSSLKKGFIVSDILISISIFLLAFLPIILKN